MASEHLICSHVCVVESDHKVCPLSGGSAHILKSGLAWGEVGAAGIHTICCGNLWIPSWMACSWQEMMLSESQNSATSSATAFECHCPTLSGWIHSASSVRLACRWGKENICLHQKNVFNPCWMLATVTRGKSPHGTLPIKQGHAGHVLETLQLLFADIHILKSGSGTSTGCWLTDSTWACYN